MSEIKKENVTDIPVTPETTPVIPSQQEVPTEKDMFQMDPINSMVTVDRMQRDYVRPDEASVYWGELRTSMIRKKMLTGEITSVERQKIGPNETMLTASVNYGGFKVIIPLQEMNIMVSGNQNDLSRKARFLNTMIGSEVDFIVTHMQEDAHFVVASRRLAMEQKVNDFYISKRPGTDTPMIKVGSVVQARIISLNRDAMRLEVFGVECMAKAYDMQEAWLVDAREVYHVGGRVPVCVTDVKYGTKEDGSPCVESIMVDGKMVDIEKRRLSGMKPVECVRNGHYSGTVTGTSDGIYFMRLKEGVNAIGYKAETCLTIPNIGDKVIFICTSMNKERNNAVGIITRVY